MKRVLVVVFVLSTSAGGASGQAFNVDCAGIFATPPDSAYGAAAASPGHWNAVYAQLTILKGLDGVTSTVRFASDAGGAFLLDMDGASSGDAALMGSASAVDDLDAAGVFFGLEPGFYDLYVYCWGGSLVGPSNVTIRAVTGAGQVVGGVSYDGSAWPGGQALGVTYDRLRIEVTPGDGQFLDIAIQAPGDFNVINGIQLVPVPTPGAAAMGVIGALFVVRRRR